MGDEDGGNVGCNGSMVFGRVEENKRMESHKKNRERSNDLSWRKTQFLYVIPQQHKVLRQTP